MFHSTTPLVVLVTAAAIAGCADRPADMTHEEFIRALDRMRHFVSIGRYSSSILVEPLDEVGIEYVTGEGRLAFNLYVDPTQAERARHVLRAVPGFSEVTSRAPDSHGYVIPATFGDEYREAVGIERWSRLFPNDPLVTGTAREPEAQR